MKQTPLTLDQSVDRVMRQLDDEAGEVWSRDLVEEFVQDGYESICREAEPLFDMVMYDRQPYVGNYTRPFEREYMTGPILKQFNFTKASDKDYLPPAPYTTKGPCNHTSQNDSQYFTSSDEPASTATINYLPDDVTSVSRVTHDWLRLMPENSRYLRQARISYETEQGGVFSYSMDQDGLFALRTVGVPIRTINPEEISGIYGALRQITSYSYDEETVIGTHGVIRQLPEHFMAKSQQYGGMKRIVPDDNATRVEYFRLGAELKKHPFEIPYRAVRYVEWWAQHRAYSQPGQGEDKLLAEHFRMRYQTGVERMKQRVRDLMQERTYGMGQRRLHRRDSYLERFPVDYGYKRPFKG